MIGLLLIAAGAILLWALNVSSNQINIHVIGAILLVIGVVAFLFELFWFYPRWFSRRDL